MAVRKHFIRSLQIVAAELGRKFGITVHLGGREAYTNGETIVLPYIGDEFGELELLGYLNHEAGHVRFSDFNTIATFNEAFERSVLNAIEDVRIENEMSKLYAGSRSLMDAAVKSILDDQVKQYRRPSSSKLNPGILITSYLVAAGQVKVAGTATYRALSECLAAKLTALFNADIMAKLNAVIDEMPTLKSTSDTIALTKKVLCIFQDAARQIGSPAAGSGSQQEGNDTGESPADSNAQSGQDDSGKSGRKKKQKQKDRRDQKTSGKDADDQDDSGKQPADGEDFSQSRGGDALKSTDGSLSSTDAQSQGSDPGQGKDSSQSKGERSESDASSDNGNAGGSGAGRGGSSASQGTQTAAEAALAALSMQEKDASKVLDVSSQMQVRLKSSARKREKEERIRTYPVEVCSPKDDQPIQERSIGSLQNEFTKARETLRMNKAEELNSRMQRSLLGFLQAESRVKAWSAERGMRLSTTNLTRALCGSSRIFERRVEARAVDTAVHVLLDLSGSMYSRENDAIAAAVAITATMMRIPHVNPALSVLMNTSFIPVVRHGVRNIENVRPAIGLLRAEGGTPMADCISKAACALARARANRHILMVITDGKPSLPEQTQNLIQRLEAEGVFVLGIGVELDRDDLNMLRTLFRNFVHADELTDLPDKLFESARQVLGYGIAANRRAA